MDIQIYGSSVLTKKAEPVASITPELISAMNEMAADLKSLSAVGLAAPQVGVSERYFVMHAGDKLRLVINPEIIKEGSASVEMEEGCVSVPGIHKKVRRPRRISVKYTDENGNEVSEELKDYPARVFMHEYDHLDGIMFVDRLTPIAKKMIAKQLEDLKETHK
ncbi:MAG: peptide deformylase [Methanocorpusculum sp.]|nr:peptide deformylase [Methanocorpusculum sp.]